MYQNGPLLLSDLETYDSGTSDNQRFSFSYDSASSSSSSPFMSPEHGLPLHLMSPSISITSNSPRSESGALSPPLQDCSGNMFDFDYGASAYAGDYSSTSWSPSHLSPSTLPKPSSSPCPSNGDMSDIASSISRDVSPLRGENEKPDRRRFPCHIIGCERKFTSQYTLKVHMEAHKPKPRVSFPCTEGCSERFSRQHDRLRHEVAKHGKVCEFLCDDCGRFFSTKKTLGNHKCPVAQGGTRWVAS
ncbi:hypothetical protein BKA70DRAFT_1373276 [Coprinopsis sp. MPI-PUGE-AT-0042]|nr:hypothetical protein BKA70DRAFT_1373276 [Coprinopsis sp. MPI-PUGE-AT-0042]